MRLGICTCCLFVQVHEQGLSPWQLPTVRSSSPPKVHQHTLTLEQLRHYQHQYPYSLPRHQQQQHAEQLPQHGSHMLRVIGRPGSAGGAREDHQPLLQQQLDMHEQQLDMQRWQLPQQSQQGTPVSSSPRRQQQQRSLAGSPVRQQQLGQEHGSRLSTPVPQQQQQQDHQQRQQPWHESPGRHTQWYSNAQGFADTHWQERRSQILGTHKPGNDSSNVSSSVSRGRSVTPSSASSLVGSDADIDARQQQYLLEQHQLQHGLYGKWAAKTWERPGPADKPARAASPQPKTATTDTAADDSGSNMGEEPVLKQHTMSKSQKALAAPGQSHRGTSVSSTGPNRMAGAQTAIGQKAASLPAGGGGTYGSPSRKTIA